MFLSRILFSRTALLVGLAVAGLLWAARPASAQQPPYVETARFDRPNAGAALPGAFYAPWYAPPAPVVARAPAVLPQRAGPLVVTATFPASAETAAVTLRGPDGEVQRYPLEGGPQSIQTRTVIVRQGETASFHFALAAPSR